jgi:membrane-associated protease RseP (regulator of RpoE activity)
VPKIVQIVIMSQSPQMYEPRLCHVSKRADFDGYGFNLHAEKGRPGQYIGKVDENSPAEFAGLRQGDRIIEVNGVNIGSETHKQVVDRIKSVADSTKLLVIDPKADIHNHQQLELITKMKKSTEEKKVADKVNNNGKVEESIMESQSHLSTDNHNGTNGTNGTTPIEIKVETNGNGGAMSLDSTDSSSSVKSSSTSGGTLHLPMTVAEMRAQLKNKKRPDPKTEGLDVRKKYEIIQKM